MYVLVFSSVLEKEKKNIIFSIFLVFFNKNMYIHMYVCSMYVVCMYEM